MLYIHIPFCKQRCVYCDFYSTIYDSEVSQQYAEALCAELKTYKTAPSPPLQSIYIGGGTPSILKQEVWAKILRCLHECFQLASTTEFTVEMNPDDVCPTLIDTFIHAGVNRISLGVQTFNNETLSLLNRRHTAQQAIAAINLIHAKGLHNISIDLIYGLPNQSLEDWKNDLKTACRLPIKHLSAYNLMYEPGTKLSTMKETGAVSEAPDELIEQMYLTLCHTLAHEGFSHYEISNFAKPHYESKHNSGYWNATPYIGVGAGAHSFNGVDRFYNRPSVQAYIRHAGRPPRETEPLTPQQRINEYVFTRLRTSAGIDLAHFANRFGEAETRRILSIAEPFISRKQMLIANNHLSISEQAILVSDDIMSEFMSV